MRTPWQQAHDKNEYSCKLLSYMRTYKWAIKDAITKDIIGDNARVWAQLTQKKVDEW